MAGVRKTPKKSGKYQAWFVDHAGKRKFFTGTQRKSETLKIARRLEDEHKQIRLGYRPVPTTADKYRDRTFMEVAEEHIRWGSLQGGTGGRPWSEGRVTRKADCLKKWRDTLEIETLGDLDGILPRVEAALQEMAAQGFLGNTLGHRKAVITSFCNWCVLRGYLNENPLKNLKGIDRTPRTQRRALTPEELHRLLRVAPAWRRLLYEMALVTGLRVKELRSLTVDHLDTKQCGLWLDGKWTKNHKPGFQPLPSRLVKRLVESRENGMVPTLCRQYLPRLANPDKALLYVPSHPAKLMDKDLRAAAIPKVNQSGRLDFHALRTSFVTLAVEAGANIKEAQTLARHSTPTLTANVYARTRDERLAQLAERVGETVLFEPECAKSVHREYQRPREIPINLLSGNGLQRGNTKRGLHPMGTDPAIIPWSELGR